MSFSRNDHRGETNTHFDAFYMRYLKVRVPLIRHVQRGRLVRLALPEAKPHNLAGAAASEEKAQPLEPTSLPCGFSYTCRAAGKGLGLVASGIAFILLEFDIQGLGSSSTSCVSRTVEDDIDDAKR